MYFTKHSDEEVQTKAIIGLGKKYYRFDYAVLVKIHVYQQELMNLCSGKGVWLKSKFTAYFI